MSNLAANGPQRIFSPTGEFMAWDTLFLQKASVPTLKHYIGHPNDPLPKKPKRPDNFVIALEKGPPGMLTPSAGSKQALYKQALGEYRTQTKLHAALQEWMKTTLHPDLYKACCIPGQTAFQWRTNLVGRMTQMQLEPPNTQEVQQATSDAQKRDHDSMAADDSDNERPRKKQKGAKREARRQREETIAHQISTLEEEVRRLSALSGEVDRLKTLVSSFQMKVTSLGSGYGSGSATTRKFTSQPTESFSKTKSASSLESGSESDDGSATPGSDEDGSDCEFESNEEQGNNYTSLSAVATRKVVSSPISSSTAYESESSSGGEVDNYLTLPPARSVQQRPLNLAHAVGTELLSEDYTSSPPVPMIDCGRFAIPAQPIQGTTSAPKKEQDQPDLDVDDATGSSDIADGNSEAGDLTDESDDGKAKFKSGSDEPSGDESSGGESEDGAESDSDDDGVEVKVEDISAHHVKDEPADVDVRRRVFDKIELDESDESTLDSDSSDVERTCPGPDSDEHSSSGSEEGSVSGSEEGSVSGSEEGSVSGSEEGSVSGSDAGSVSGSDEENSDDVEEDSEIDDWL